MVMEIFLLDIGESAFNTLMLISNGSSTAMASVCSASSSPNIFIILFKTIDLSFSWIIILCLYLDGHSLRGVLLTIVKIKIDST